jgi:hypothetical protein
MTENKEENIQDQLSLKQELLKNEIIAKNYDGQKFLEYCINLKENGDDMNNWTYEELKLVVENFKADYDHKKEKSKEQTNKEITHENNDKKINEDDIETEKLDDIDINKTDNENNKKDSETKEENNNIPSKEISNDKSLKDKLESKIKEFPCKLLEKSILNDKEIKVTVKNPKTNEKTLLSLAYVTYEVYTEPYLWLVRRRYNDFSLLRNILCKFYPRNLIPPLPEKKIGGKRFQPEFIEKRMKILQMFLDEVTCNETLKSSDALITFLNVIDHTFFEKKMKELYNKPFNQNFEDIKTINGKVNTLSQDIDSDIFFSKINSFYTNQKQVFKRLTNSLKNFYHNAQTVCQNLEEISKSFGELEKLNKEMNIEEEVTKTYEMLKLFFQERKKILEKENEIIHDKIKGFFKLQKLKINSFIEIIDSRENLRQKYNTEYTKLNSKKEKLYTSVKDINKWEISNAENIDKPLLLRDKKYAFDHMCSKESQNIESMKKLLEFCNYNNYMAFKKINKENVKNFVDNMKDFTDKIFPYINDGFNIGKKLRSYI